MPADHALVTFPGRLLMLGFGCIGRGVLPLLARHIDMPPERIRILTDHAAHRDVAAARGIALRVETVARDNYRRILAEELGPGDFLLNLSINVGSLDLIAWCQEHGVLYLDACIEPWAGGYTDAALSPSQRSNYGLREQALHGFLVTHGESISIADYLTVREGEAVAYRPTVHYAYHPCDDAVLSLHELAGKNWHLQERRRELVDGVITAGMDELGVLLCGHARNIYWYGSRLTIEEARALCPDNNATSLQTAAGVLGDVVWAMRHPAAGIVDPEEMDWREVLDVARPYLGQMVGVFGAWTPLAGRGELFAEDIDTSDPWQFKNVRA